MSRPGGRVRAKQRSVHNNYLTLPVLVAMLGDHFAFAYGHEDGSACARPPHARRSLIRLFFNLRHAGRTVVDTGQRRAALAAVAVWIRPPTLTGRQTGRS